MEQNNETSIHHDEDHFIMTDNVISNIPNIHEIIENKEEKVDLLTIDKFKDYVYICGETEK